MYDYFQALTEYEQSGDKWILSLLRWALENLWRISDIDTADVFLFVWAFVCLFLKNNDANKTNKLKHKSTQFPARIFSLKEVLHL